MTPVNSSLSPMSQSNKFDFDARKVNRDSESSSCGSELTPMLAPGAPRACARIDEEADDVFDTNLTNLTNITNNAKNTLNYNGAVTNPTYITFGVDNDKKSQNTYINVPNGLVK